MFVGNTKHMSRLIVRFQTFDGLNKYEKKELVTCQLIKTEQQSFFKQAEEKIEQGLTVPIMSEYYMRLASIDFNLSREFYPINVAIRKAIEYVLSYYAYR